MVPDWFSAAPVMNVIILKHYYCSIWYLCMWAVANTGYREYMYLK